MSSNGTLSPKNIPEFIDTSDCLCGLVAAPAASTNGEQVEMWRCIGDASQNVELGNSGKWYNTSLPSQELSAVGEPQNWDGNPPDLNHTYILVGTGGSATYQNYTSGSSPELIGNDEKCTGKNDTSLSKEFYMNGVAAIMSTSSTSADSAATSPSSPLASSSPSSSLSKASMTSGSLTATSPTSTTSSTTGSQTSASATSGTSKNQLKAVILVGLFLAPLVSLLH